MYPAGLLGFPSSSLDAAACLAIDSFVSIQDMPTDALVVISIGNSDIMLTLLLPYTCCLSGGGPDAVGGAIPHP